MTQQVIEGRDYADALRDTLASWGARRVVVATNRSLAREGRLGHAVAAALQGRCVRLVDGIRAHAPRADVLRLAEALRSCEADALVGVGGGSVTSAVKIARLALANDVRDEGGFDALMRQRAPSPPRPRCIMLPTTLSGGEYTTMAGTTDLLTQRKEALAHPGLAPEVVVIDPALARDTPRELWFGTAIRALDHLVETWCSTAPSAHGDECVRRGLPLLLQGLRSGDTLKCQQAARWAIGGIAGGVPQGASHGIGHALGGVAGVPHGDTSCVMLAHVLRFNAPVNGERQDALLKLWPGGPAPGSLADQVQGLVVSLGLRSRLRETGIAKDVLPDVAREAMRSPWVAANPRRIDGAAEVLQLLDRAW